MALTDLHTELVKDTFKVDLENEKKIVNKLLAMVAEDGSGDIKGLAVKWCAHLAPFAEALCILPFWRCLWAIFILA